jgi:hypothetical protein
MNIFHGPPAQAASGLIASIKGLRPLTTLLDPDFTVWKLELKQIFKIEGLWAYVNDEVKPPACTNLYRLGDAELEIHTKKLQASGIIILAMDHSLRMMFIGSEYDDPTYLWVILKGMHKGAMETLCPPSTPVPQVVVVADGSVTVQGPGNAAAQESPWVNAANDNSWGNDNATSPRLPSVKSGSEASAEMQATASVEETPWGGGTSANENQWGNDKTFRKGESMAHLSCSSPTQERGPLGQSMSPEPANGSSAGGGWGSNQVQPPKSTQTTPAAGGWSTGKSQSAEPTKGSTGQAWNSFPKPTQSSQANGGWDWGQPKSAESTQESAGGRFGWHADDRDGAESGNKW